MAESEGYIRLPPHNCAQFRQDMFSGLYFCDSTFIFAASSSEFAIFFSTYLATHMPPMSFQWQPPSSVLFSFFDHYSWKQSLLRTKKINSTVHLTDFQVPRRWSGNQSLEPSRTAHKTNICNHNNVLCPGWFRTNLGLMMSKQTQSEKGKHPRTDKIFNEL